MPGWCRNRTVFQDLAPGCSAHRRTLVLDWRGHGGSGQPKGDFGFGELVSDAIAVIEASGSQQVVPVALAHSGWIAIELRRRLRQRIPKLVLVDWIVLEPPKPFLEALKGMQDPDKWRQTVEHIFSQWLQCADNKRLIQFVRREMGSYGFQMWARAAREIAAAYAESGSPLHALSSFNPPLPVLHLYAQPPDPNYLAAQQKFASSHSWFNVLKLEARSHFPMFEVSDQMASAIERFVR